MAAASTGSVGGDSLACFSEPAGEPAPGLTCASARPHGMRHTRVMHRLAERRNRMADAFLLGLISIARSIQRQIAVTFSLTGQTVEFGGSCRIPPDRSSDGRVECPSRTLVYERAESVGD